MASKQNSTLDTSSYIDSFIAAIRPLYDNKPGMMEFANGAYWERFRDIGPPFNQILKGALGKYEKINGMLNDQTPVREQFRELIGKFPSFFFYIAVQLRKEEAFKDLSKELMVAGVCCLIVNRLPGRAALNFLIQSIDRHSDTASLSARLFEKEKDDVYLPRILFMELFMISKQFQITKTSNKLELIVNEFITKGMFQIFIKYYFRLLELAPNSDIADHLDEVFSNFFVSLRKQETNVWAGLPNIDILKVQVNHIISLNKHPYCYRERFEELNKSFYLLRIKDDLDNSELQTNLKIWHSFSESSMALFSNIVLICRGSRIVSFLLLSLFDANESQFIALGLYLKGEPNQKKFKDLFLIYQKVYKAKQKEKAPKPKALPKKEEPEKVPDIRTWGPCLKRFYQQIEMSGVLTDGELPVFFQGFTKAATEMLQKGEVTPEASANFKKTLNDLMENCIARSTLNKQEVKIYQNQINREVTDVEAVDFDERSKKIDSIGMVLVEANKKQEKYEQLFRESLPIQLTVNYNTERISFSVEDILLLPLPNRQKERLLEAYMPSLISEDMMMAIYNIKLSGSDGADVTASVYDMGKYTNLKIATLIKLLEASNGFKGLLQKKLIHVEHNNKSVKLKLSEFFRFPLSSNKEKSDPKYFTQHVNYLKFLTDRNQLPLSIYEIVLNHLDEFPKIEYSQYFQIFRGRKFDHSSMAALIDLWQNKGLESLEA